MNPETEFINNDILPYRVRPGNSNKALLLLHGWTGDENSMTVFTGKFSEDYWLFFPRAPFSANSVGFSWRDSFATPGWPSFDLFRNSGNLLINFMQEVKIKHNLAFSQFDVCGFSQGGAMTFTLGTLFPENIRKMGILSGFAPLGSEREMKSELFIGKQIFISHGSQDLIVPISMAHNAIELLKNNGAKVIFSESQCGHKLSSHSLRALEQYLFD